MKPYHKYVFDKEQKKFVGNFEGMYKNEDIEGFDSWQSSDLTHLPKKIHLAILESYNFNSILDFGCGKGTFTHLLKKNNNDVLGVDISDTAIQKAKNTYNDRIDFEVMSENNFHQIIGKRNFDLTIVLETLSYIKEWKGLIKNISKISRYIYISLYVPKDPIGFVKSFDELTNEISEYFIIQEKLIYNEESIFILARGKEV